MNTSFDEIVVLIMGLPIRDFPVPPTDEGQSGHEKQNCPECREPIWVSINKRRKLKEIPGAKLLCAYCCAKKAAGNDFVMHNILEEGRG